MAGGAYVDESSECLNYFALSYGNVLFFYPSKKNTYGTRGREKPRNEIKGFGCLIMGRLRSREWCELGIKGAAE